MCGTDYGHTDQASELDALRELGNKTGVSQAVVDKILGVNPMRLFGFDAKSLPRAGRQALTAV